MNDKTQCSLSNGFKLWEKIYAQTTFIGMGIIGTVAIVIVDWRWIPPYFFIYFYGIFGIVMRHLACPRCPHLYIHGDCLQAPPKIARWLIKKQKINPFSALEKLLWYMIFVLIPTYPIYWLLSNRILLVVFLIFTGAWYLGQFLYFCKRCRVKECPFNRAV